MPNTATSGVQRRLSARRGSLTALDPYAVHADINENPNRTSSSKLTIVRVLPSQPPQQPSAPITLNEAPSSFSPSASRRRRLGSSGASGAGTGASSTSQPDTPPPGRLSFAFASFGSAAGTSESGHQVGEHQRTGSGSGGGGGRPSSPSSSPRLRPSSPRLSAMGGGHHYQHPGIALKSRLRPDQLVELARQASSPRTLAQIANSTAPHSAGPASPAPSSAGTGPGSVGASPVLRSQPLGGGGGVAGAGVSTNVAPATFVPLPDDIFLPFIDRPSEVAQLISIPPDAKLFALLAQTLPKSEEPPETAGEEELPRDPSVWTYDHLMYHLTQVDRDVAPDPIWAFAARKCIHSRSELIWERVKGGLGVPPELDIDYDFTYGGTTHQRSSSQEKLHAKMRKLRQELRDGAPKNRLGDDSQNESALDDDDDDALESDDDEEDEEYEGAGGKWTGAASVRGVDKPSPAGSIPAAVRRSDSAHEVGGVVIGSFNNHSSSVDIATVGPSPPMGAMVDGLDDEDIDDDDDFISIEPLIAPSQDAVGSLGANPPPLSLGTSALLEEGLASDTPAGEGMGLGDIAEGEEEEEEEDGDDAGVSGGDSAGQPTAETKQEPEEELIPPSLIQGLRILTSPVHAAGSYGVGGLFVPHHHHPSNLLHSTSTDGSTSLTDLSMMASPLPMTPAGEDRATGAGTTLAQALASGAHDASAAHTQPHVISPPAGGHRTHSRTSSFSSITGISIGPFSRSESTGSLAALLAAQQQQQHHYSGSDAGDSAGYASDWSVGATGGGSASASVAGGQVEVVGDRLPGQPLFVSNFARLNGCPTLKGGVPNPAAEQRRNHGPSRFKLARTGSTGAVVGSVPSSNFVGSHTAGHSHLSGHSKTPSSDVLDTPSSPKARTYSHGSLYGQGRSRPGSWTASKGAN